MSIKRYGDKPLVHNEAVVLIKTTKTNEALAKVVAEDTRRIVQKMKRDAQQEGKMSHKFDLSGTQIEATDAPTMVVTLHIPGNDGFGIARYIGSLDDLKGSALKIFESVAAAAQGLPQPHANAVEVVDESKGEGNK